MHYTKNSISNYQSGVELLFRKSIHQEGVKNTVVNYGYDEKQLQRIYDLNKELSQVVTATEQAKVNKALLFNRKNELLKSVKRIYMRYLKLARIALVDDVKAEQALMLSGARFRTNKELLFQINVFTSNLLNSDEWLAQLRVYNISLENLTSLNEQLKELARLTEICIEAQGEVKKYTVLKKKKLIEVQGYVSDYLKVVRIALEEKPKLLKSLGIKVRGDY